MTRIANRRSLLALPVFVTIALAISVRSFATAAPVATRPAPGQPRPNIVFILADDLGWRDVACYGTKYYETPHIDRLATQGMRFTQAYAACPVCSPTRASILTGKYPARLHLTDWIPGHPYPKAKLTAPEFHHELPLAEVTIAEALKPAGYASALIGKWHLGGPGFYPTDQGFDVNLGGTDKGQPASYFSPYRIATLPDGPPGEYVTDRLTREAEQFIEGHKEQPFFLMLTHFAVHTPLQAKPEVIAKYKAKAPDGGQKNPVYAAMVEALDDSVGRVLRKLDELSLADRTIVVFFSDNGGLTNGDRVAKGPTDNAPLRAGKGTLYEGGIREPLIVRWPGIVKPGTTCETPVISNDVLPTLLEAAGVPRDPKVPCDGMSLVPLLARSGDVRRDAFYWHYPHYHPGGATPCGAIRAGDWKLIEFFEDGRVELYHLKDDPSEEKDLAFSMPERAQELRLKLAAWRKAVDAQMPAPNKP